MKCFTDKRELSSMKWATNIGNNIGFNETNKQTKKALKSINKDTFHLKTSFHAFLFYVYIITNLTRKITNIRELTKIDKIKRN